MASPLVPSPSEQEMMNRAFNHGSSGTEGFRSTITDSSGNEMPAMDDPARAGYVTITDGVETANVTAQNELNVLDSGINIETARGNVPGVSSIHKFGNAPDFDTGDGVVSIWDGANDGGINQMTYTYSTTAAIDSLSSSSGADTMDIEVQGLDASFAQVTQTITLTGQTRVALTTDLIRVFRLKNVGSTNLAGQLYCYENVATTAGVPNDLTLVRASIDNGNNQTLMAIYTIPAGKTGYMDSFFASTAGGNKSSNYIIDVYARPSGQVFQLKHRNSLADAGSSHIQHKYTVPEVFAAQTDIEMRVQITAAGVTAASISAGFDITLIDN